MQQRFAAILIVTLFPVAGWTAGAWHATASSHDIAAPRPASVYISDPSSNDDSGWSSLPYPLLEEPEVDITRDLYGNEISSAVAKYKSDRSGSVYEEHSPNTQVARLKPPTT